MPITLAASQEQVFCADDIPLLTARYTLPQGPRGRFTRYYGAYAAAFLRWNRLELFPRAEQAYCHARESAGPLPQWETALTAALTLQRPQLVSLRSDRRLTGGPERCFAARGDTWDLRRSLLLSPGDCFPPGTAWRRLLTDFAAGEIARWESQGVARYHENWQRLLPRAFHPHRFYLTEEGFCFFFPLGSIAPPTEGLPTFCLPYCSDTGPFLPQV